MDADVLARRICLAAIPVLALVAYLLRSDPADESAPPAASASAHKPSAKPAGAPSSERLGFDLGAEPAKGASQGGADKAGAATPEARISRGLPPVGEYRLKTTPLPPASMAVDLPVADGEAEALPDRGGAQLGRRGPSSQQSGPCGGVQVKLITHSKDPEWSFASIAAGADQPASIRRVGDAVGSWRVQKIEWDRVWLATSGTRCAVGMHAGAREALAAVRAKGKKDLLASAESDPPPWYVPASIARAIHKRSETEYLISPDGIAAIFKRGAQLLAGLGIEPVRRHEQVVGIELRTVQPDSLLERLGVQAGDILLAINDQPCTTLNDTIAALLEAREAGTLVARMERQGQAFDLDIRVPTEEAG